MIYTDNRFHGQVRLLVRVLPYVAKEDCFALKGGTAINLFFRDLPRLSVDIDLAYLPLSGYEESRRAIDTALRRMAKTLSGDSPGYRVTAGANDEAGLIDTLNVSDGAHTVKIEVNPVLRGSVNPPTLLTLRPVVQEEFGFAQIAGLAFEDTYAGKLMAALDRQHPRGLFDVMVLFENEGVSEQLLRTWLVYLIGHKGSMADVLNPNRKDIEGLYRGQFLTMTERPVDLDTLVDVREHLIGHLRGRLGEQEKALLLSVKRGEPRWDLLGMDGVKELPAVKWKLLNIERMSSDARARAVERLAQVLEQIE